MKFIDATELTKHIVEVGAQGMFFVDVTRVNLDDLLDPNGNIVRCFGDPHECVKFLSLAELGRLTEVPDGQA